MRFILVSNCDHSSNEINVFRYSILQEMFVLFEMIWNFYCRYYRYQWTDEWYSDGIQKSLRFSRQCNVLYHCWIEGERGGSTVLKRRNCPLKKIEMLAGKFQQHSTANYRFLMWWVPIEWNLRYQKSIKFAGMTWHSFSIISQKN